MEILVKVSGDFQDKEVFYKWLKSINLPSNDLFILCGGGTAISQILEQHGITSKFGPSGREINSKAGRQAALQVLEKQKANVEKNLEQRKIIASVFTPVFRVGDKNFHLNGDNLATALYPNFDKIFILTLKGRIKSFSKELSKIEVVYL